MANLNWKYDGSTLNARTSNAAYQIVRHTDFIGINYDILLINGLRRACVFGPVKAMGIADNHESCLMDEAALRMDVES